MWSPVGGHSFSPPARARRAPASKSAAAAAAASQSPDYRINSDAIHRVIENDFLPSIKEAKALVEKLRQKVDARDDAEHKSLYSRHVHDNGGGTRPRSVVQTADSAIGFSAANSAGKFALEQKKQFEATKKLKEAAQSPLIVELQIKHLDQLIAHLKKRRYDSGLYIDTCNAEIAWIDSEIGKFTSSREEVSARLKSKATKRDALNLMFTTSTQEMNSIMQTTQTAVSSTLHAMQKFHQRKLQEELQAIRGFTSHKETANNNNTNQFASPTAASTSFNLAVTQPLAVPVVAAATAVPAAVASPAAAVKPKKK